LQTAHPIEEPAPPTQFGGRALLYDPAYVKRDAPVEPRHGNAQPSPLLPGELRAALADDIVQPCDSAWIKERTPVQY
jgi:hypothetical protein